MEKGGDGGSSPFALGKKRKSRRLWAQLSPTIDQHVFQLAGVSTGKLVTKQSGSTSKSVTNPSIYSVWGHCNRWCSLSSQNFRHRSAEMRASEHSVACLCTQIWYNRDFRRRDVFPTDKNGTQLLLKVDEMTATHLTVLGEEHELGSSFVARCQHVL